MMLQLRLHVSKVQIVHCFGDFRCFNMCGINLSNITRMGVQWFSGRVIEYSSILIICFQIGKDESLLSMSYPILYHIKFALYIKGSTS